jgi:hypothetical protein
MGLTAMAKKESRYIAPAKWRSDAVCCLPRPLPPGADRYSVARVNVPTHQLRQPSYLFVGQHPCVEEGVRVLGPPPLVVPMVEKHQEPQLVSNDVVRQSARPKLRPVAFEEVMPLVPASSE